LPPPSSFSEDLVERVVWLALLLAAGVRKQPAKRVNPPSLRLTT
jgi:hypothetical protein